MLSVQKNYPHIYEAAVRFSRRIQNEQVRDMFVKCSLNTLATTVQQTESGVYLITGDINAMWLRDSAAQVMQYLELSPCSPDTRRLITGVVQRQCYYITCDPYANAFNFTSNGQGHREDEGGGSDIVFERKFELDSLCYPIFLADRYYARTQDDGIFTDTFFAAALRVLDVFETEQRHENSPYHHYRPTEPPELSVPNRGRGGPIGYTGMVWSGYRPSDDACIYGYNIPGNMFVATTMRLLQNIAERHGKSVIAARAAVLEKSVRQGIETFGTVQHPVFGKIYAYETDGLGHYNLMDDANVPNLLGLPYIGWCERSERIYDNTRRFCLSPHNPYYYEGKRLSGMGSPHTPQGYVWPIALMMQGITSCDRQEINKVFDMLASTTAGTGYMHESICVDNDAQFTRSWFAWADSLFAYFMSVKADDLSVIEKKK